MTDVVPIAPEPWEHDGRIVPVEGPRELVDWLDSLEREGASWDGPAAEKTPWGSGYAVVVAVRTPGPRPPAGSGGAGRDGGAGPDDAGEPPGTIRYFMISGDDVRLLAFRAGGAVARFAERLGYALGPALVPIADRWKEAWRQTFVGADQVAELLGVERAVVERWAREDGDFPLAVLERARGPLYVREEIVEWLERTGRTGPG